jgi:hypothetical protein
LGGHAGRQREDQPEPGLQRRQRAGRDEPVAQKLRFGPSAGVGVRQHLRAGAPAGENHGPSGCRQLDEGLRQQGGDVTTSSPGHDQAVDQPTDGVDHQAVGTGDGSKQLDALVGDCGDR